MSQAQHDSEALSVPLVKWGCIGIWKEALLPGAAYDVTIVDTRVQTWNIKVGSYADITRQATIKGIVYTCDGDHFGLSKETDCS